MKKFLLSVLGVLIVLPTFARDFTYTYEGQTVIYTVIDEDAKTCMTKEGSAAVNEDKDKDYETKDALSGNIQPGNIVSGELILPENPKDGQTEYTLIKIGNASFYQQRDLFYIQFPETLVEVGSNAFQGCSSLTFDEIPSSVTTIGISAFAGCESQTSITIPEGLANLGEYAFSEMKKLKRVVLFSNLDEIPDGLCCNCRDLETVYLPKKIIKIGNYAFNYTAIEEIILPQTIEIIGEHAFEYSNIQKIVCPENLKEIQDYGFAYNRTNSVKFNDNLTKIGGFAFWGHRLTEINFPSNLKEIGDEVFVTNEPTMVGRIILPDALSTIGSEALFGFYIGELIMGDGVTKLTGKFPVGYPSILTIGGNVKSIDVESLMLNVTSIIRMKSKNPPTVNESFNLTDQQIDNITFLVPDGAKAAYERNPRWKIFNIVEESEAEISVHVDGVPITEEVRLQSGIMPSLVTKLHVTGTLAEGDWRLIRENMVSLISLDLSRITNDEIPEGAFEGKNLLTEIILPRGIKKIGYSAFEGCSLIDTPEIPETVEEIGACAFEGCKMLSVNKLPNNLEKIDYNTFSGCRMLSISKLPDALRLIRDSAFENCSSLKSITAGENLTQDGEGDPITIRDIFKGCTALEFVDLSASKIQRIDRGNFADCTSLKQILWPNNPFTIGYGAFMNSGLETIEIPGYVTFIGENAFAGTKLRGINIPEGIQEIYHSIVNNCPRLLSINMPVTLKAIISGIDGGSFPSTVSALTCAAIEAPTAGTGTFSGLSARRCSLAVPRQSYRSYLNAPQWGMFANLVNSLDVTIPEDVVVTAVDEEEYQKIVEEETLLAEAESEDEEYNSEDMPMRVKAREAARETYVNSGRNYARLFNGATLGSPKTSKGTRIFINPKGDAKIKAVYYNEKDLTAQLEGNSLLLPVSANGSLRIDVIPAGLEDTIIDNTDELETATCTAYDLVGHPVFSGLRADFETSVAPGLYIVKSGSKTTKVLVR